MATLTCELAQLFRRSTKVLAALAGLAVLCSGCSSSSVVSTGPTPVKCQVSLAASSSMAADGGTGTLSVTTPPECAWDVSTTAGWITALSPTSGQGDGKVEFRVAPNPQASMREAEIVVNDSRVRVQQQAAPCEFEIRPTGLTMDAAGGTRDLDVSARAGCSWTASADANWVSFATAASGSGNGSLTVRVARNPASGRRTATIRIANQQATLIQSGEGQQCQFSISPSGQNIAASGGSGSPVTVSTDGECDWTASSNASWITVTSGSIGRGDGTVRFSVAANLQTARTGTISIADRTFTVSQAGVAAPAPAPGCSYAINPTSQSVGAGAGSGSTSVTAASGCAWTAVSNTSWITVSSGASGSGNGSVSFNVAANSGAARNGTLTIGGQTLTVTQAAASAPAAPACTYSLSPTSESVAAGGGSGTFSVSSATGCAWTASSGASWITVTSGASGSGNGSVAFSVAANLGGARTGTLTIAGQTFTVTQAALVQACTYSVSPTSLSLGKGGGERTVAVTAGTGCAWTAASNATWITITSGASGSGNGTVDFTISQNSGNGTSDRTGTLTVAGQTVTVEQKN